MHDFNSGLIVLVGILILIGGLVFLNFSSIDIPYLNWVEKGLYNIISPPVKFFMSIYGAIDSYWHGLLNTEELIEENERLKKEVSELEREVLSLQKFAGENRRLRELLAFKNYVPYEIEGAQVIGYGPSNWQDRILINKGKNNGLEEGMPVISYNGCLVGRVDFVGAGSSQVRLVYDPGFVVGGIIQREESRAIGLVEGQKENRDINIMDKIPWDADIKEGDLILTSGLSNNYPKGLPIGKVMDVKSDNYGLSLQALVELFASMKTLEEVLVITDF